MCVGSLVIAVTPTFATIGVWAAVILAAARILQGLSLGGEYGTSATYLSEVADEKHRGFYSSFQYVTLIGGQLCAIVVLLVLQGWLLTPLQLRAWGWRIPFAIGGLLAIVAAIMRRSLVETDSYLEVSKHKSAHRQNSLRELMRYPKEVTLVIGLTMGGTAAFYTYTTYMQKFLKLSVHLTDSQTTIGHGRFADLRHADAAHLRCYQRPHRTQVATDRIRRLWHALHHSPADGPARHAQRHDGLPADCHRLAHCLRLYVHQRRGQGGALPGRGARHRSRTALCADSLHLRRHGGIRCAVVQKDWA